VTSELTYRASADSFVIWVSVLVSLLILGIGVGALRVAFVATSSGLRVTGWVVLVACLSFLAAAYLYSPRGFRLSDTSVTVVRPGRDVEIPVTSVESVDPIRISLMGATRTFGNGGLFGVYGRYRNAELGPFTMYGSRLGDAVLLKTKRGSVVVTPDDGEAFTEEVRARLADAG
jgi:hypothetical protein